LIEVEKEKTRVPAAAAIFLPFGSAFRRMSHLFHTSTAPAAAAVASVMAAAAVAAGPTAAPGSPQEYSPPQVQSAPAQVADEVPPLTVTDEVIVEGNDERPALSRGTTAPVQSSPPPVGASSAPSTPPPPDRPSQPQECKLPVTGTDFPALPAIGCPFTVVPPR
ncbi:MAG: hypothetical protein ACRD1T_15890, partial [Acidimicrobiia bacterium]